MLATPRLLALPFALFVALAAGCTDAESPAGSGATTTGAAGSGGSGTGTTSSSSTTTEPGTTTLTAQFGPVNILSGEEAVQCLTVGLGNPEGVFVRRFRTKLNEGSHHMIVYLTSAPPDPTPYPCMSFAVEGGSAIFIAQQAESELVLPTDPSGVPVGLELGPQQALNLEVHYINSTASALDVVGSIELDVLPITANIIPSGLAFQGAFQIPEIPAFGEADTGVLFQDMLPSTRVFALTTHQHHLGTRMSVWHANDVDDLSTMVADSLSWSDPPLELFDPPLEFPADGSKGFAYQCHWKNPTSEPVYGGLSANDEMCFFWSYFYQAP